MLRPRRCWLKKHSNLLLRMQTLRFDVDLGQIQLPHKGVTRVALDGVEIVVPPKGEGGKRTDGAGGGKPRPDVTIAEIARIRGQDPVSACFDLIYEEGGFIHGVHHTMNEEDVKTVMRVPWVSIGSDGSALNLKYPGKPHPRSFGRDCVQG